MTLEAVFIKPYSSSFCTEELTLDRALSNKKNNIETIIIPDVNVLIAMEKLIHYPNTKESYLKKGILGIMSFMNKCTEQEIPIWWAPYFALLEMPGKNAYDCFNNLKKFDSKHFRWEYEECHIDNSTFNKTQISKEFPLINNEVEKEFLAHSFYCLLLINIIERDLSELTPFNKLLAYLNLVEHKIGLLSIREFIIATLIFSPKSKEDLEFNKLKKDICENFGFKNRTLNYDHDLSIAMIKKATNGARDLSYLSICCMLHNNTTEKRDVWLATGDLKLFAFNKFVYSIGGNGMLGKKAVINFPTCKNIFFNRAIVEFSLRTSMRQKLIEQVSNTSITNNMIRSCYEIIDLAGSKLTTEKIPKYGQVIATPFSI